MYVVEINILHKKKFSRKTFYFTNHDSNILKQTLSQKNQQSKKTNKY